MQPLRHKRRILLVAASLLAIILALGIAQHDPLIVALSAPKAASGMTLFVVTERGLLDRLGDSASRAEYSIYYGDRLIYPPAAKGASFPIDGRAGSVFIPYHHFVVGNGDYDIVVKYAGTETRARVIVEKWVEYVHLRPFDRGNTILIEAALASATGGRPEDRILTSGDLILNIHYRGIAGTENRTIGSVVASTRNDAISTSLDVPRSRLNQGPGYYSFEPIFHNLEARDNVQVAGDPTMANHKPPWNWIYVSA